MSKLFASLAIAAALAIPSMASAHSAVFSCFDNGDGTVTCQGGYSDGSSASGVKVIVKDGAGSALENLKLDANSEITFKKPTVDYSVMMDGGEGHSVSIPGKDIVE